MKRIIKNITKKGLHLLGLKTKTEQLFHDGKIRLLGKDFHFYYWPACQASYHEIFIKGIYNFRTHNNIPVIIDCGANMGMSLLFFSINYPAAKIYAFEPDVSVIDTLIKNIETYQMTNVELFKKAVWDSNGFLEFFTDGGMGGRLENNYRNQDPTIVETIRLRDFIGQKYVDFLKMDIEGAEFVVIKDCEPVLKQIDNIFIEYHGMNDEEQHLDNILQILKRNGFRYHLSQSFSRNKPFIDRELICEKIDMAINIFGYR